MSVGAYVKVFIWGFFLGVVSIAGSVGYIYVKVFKDDDANMGKARREEEDGGELTTTKILQSLGIAPSSPTKTSLTTATTTPKASAGVGAPWTPKGGAEGASSGAVTPPHSERSSSPLPPSSSPPPPSGTSVAVGGEAAAGVEEGPGEAAIGDRTSVNGDASVTGEGAGGEDRDLEEGFMEAVKLSKCRLKDIKSFMSTVQTLTALTTAHAKALEKVATTSEAAGNQFKKEAGLTTTSSTSSSKEEVYWSPLASSLEQISDEHRRLGEVLGKDLQEKIHQVHERHTLLDKQLNVEGYRLLKDLHDMTEAYRMQEKEYQRAQNKLQMFLEKGQKLGKSQPDLWESAEGKKLHKRLQEVEGDLQAVDEKVAEANVAFNDKMPMILRDFWAMEKTSVDTVRVIVMELGEQLRQVGESDMKAGLTFRTTMEHLNKNEYEVVLDDAMKHTERPDDSEKPFKLDMYSDSMAALAATNPARIPKLPSQLVAGIGKESCVWFNAFTGRMYRDACSSPLFHEWMQRLMSNLLNKGSRPGYIDEFQITNIRFGEAAVPPMLQNMRWLPTSALEGAELNYDIAFTADMMYRGGFGFKVSTKLWLNWPTDRAAALPMSVDIELIELSGQVRMGVRKNQSYFSFLHEPHSRFTVKPCLGETKQLTFTNVPKISSFMIKKMQQAIKSKLVYPKCKTIKLLWPKNWWPETTEAELLRRAGKEVPPHHHHHNVPTSPLGTSTTSTTMDAPLSPLGTSDTPAHFLHDDQFGESSKSPIPTTTTSPSSTTPRITTTGLSSTTTTTTTPPPHNSTTQHEPFPMEATSTSTTTMPLHGWEDHPTANDGDSTNNDPHATTTSSSTSSSEAPSSARQGGQRQTPPHRPGHQQQLSDGGSCQRKSTSTTGGGTGGRLTGAFNNFYKNIKVKMAQQTETAGQLAQSAGELATQAINNHVRRHNSQGSGSGMVPALLTPGSARTNDLAGTGTSTSTSMAAKEKEEDDDDNNSSSSEGSVGGTKGKEDEEADPEAEAEDREMWAKLAPPPQGGGPASTTTTTALDMSLTGAHVKEESATVALPSSSSSSTTDPTKVPPSTTTTTTIRGDVLVEAPTPPSPNRPASAAGVTSTTSTLHNMWEGTWDEGEGEKNDASSGVRRGSSAWRSSASSSVTDGEQPGVKLSLPDKEGQGAGGEGGSNEVEEQNLVAVLDTESRSYQIRVKDKEFMGRSMSLAPEMCGGHSRKATGDYTLPELTSLDKPRLVRRHTFSSLTEHQSKYISIQIQPKGSSTTGGALQQSSRNALEENALRRVKSRDDCYEYSEQRNHWWTRQLQGIYSPTTGNNANNNTSTTTTSTPEASGTPTAGFSASSLKSKLAARAGSPGLTSLARKIFNSSHHHGGTGGSTISNKDGAVSGEAYMSDDDNDKSPSPTPFIMEGPGECVMTGWLREDGMGVGSLAMQRKRWAKLDANAGTLYLYENDKSVTAKSQLSLGRSVCRLLKDSKTHGFELNASKISNGNLLSPKRTVFHAATEEEAKQWVEQLQKAVNARRGMDFDDRGGGAGRVARGRGLSPATSVGDV